MKSIWRNHKKKIIFSTILLVFGFGFYYVYVRLPIITGYAAKDMCSCVFIADRDPESVAENEFQFSLIKHASYEVNEKDKSVTSSVFGMGDKTAYYTPQNGCVILNDIDRKDWKYHKEELYPVREIPLADNTANFADNKQLDDAIKKHFKDDDSKKPFGARAVVVLKDGKLIAEHYADGFDKDSKHIGWSMTKSIFNALTGIAIEQGKLEGLDQSELFPEWKDRRKAIKLKQILQMNTGLQWEEDYGDVSEAVTMLYNRDNMVDYAISQMFEGDIGRHWEYSSGSSNMLSGILRDRMTEKEYFDFPYKYFFDKIGASSFIMETDAAGNFVSSSYAWATARDWAKFGQFFLDEGVVDSTRILPEGWIDFTTEVAEGSKGEYGAHFWLPTNKDYPRSPKDMYFADGFQGQRVFIVPSEGLVIVRLGLTRFDHPVYDDLVMDVIEALK
ncbi:MAG: serine hydrolase domain-containing protein [Crocinitomicaceae bacterium]